MINALSLTARLASTSPPVSGARSASIHEQAVERRRLRNRIREVGVISTPGRRDPTVAVSAADVTFRDLLKDPAERDVTPGYEPFDMGDLAASNMVEVEDQRVGFAAVDTRVSA